jgi:hypothetical protein
MIPALLQVTESADGYDSVTVALFALFVVALATTAGLLLRDMLQPGTHAVQDDLAGRAGIQAGDASLHSISHTTERPPGSRQAARQADPAAVPAWYRQAVAGQSHGAAEGVRATIERMVDAANRGDLRLGFSLYTPELLGRHQQALGLDAGEFERLLRGEPRPADPRMAIGDIAEITIDPPHRASAVVRYAPSENVGRPDERIDFVYDDRNLIWLIDEIATIS